jgi:hypothetical protein
LVKPAAAVGAVAEEVVVLLLLPEALQLVEPQEPHLLAMEWEPKP